MFETASWTRRNRRLFAALELLARRAGSEVVTAQHAGPDLSEPQRATALADAGLNLLDLLVDTAALRVAGNHRAARRLAGRLSGQTAADAAVFLAHAMAASMERAAGSEAARHRRARALLRAHFAWSDREDELVRDAVVQIDPDDASGLEQARIALSFHSLAIAVGEQVARTQPAFEVLAQGDDHEIDQLFNVSWAHALRLYVELV